MLPRLLLPYTLMGLNSSRVRAIDQDRPPAQEMVCIRTTDSETLFEGLVSGMQELTNNAATLGSLVVAVAGSLCRLRVQELKGNMHRGSFTRCDLAILQLFIVG